MQITQVPSTEIPFTNSTPLSEARNGAVGMMTQVPRADHQHPRLSSATNGTLAANGEATVTFTRTFPNKPSMVLTYIESADSQPVILKVKSWVMTGSDYTGCVIKGYRGQTIPTNLVTLLLGGVFNLFAGTVTGVEFTAIALAPST